MIDGAFHKPRMDLQKQVRRLQTMRRQFLFERRAVARRRQQLPARFQMAVTFKQAYIHPAQTEQRDDRQRAVVIQQRKRKIGAT